MSQWSGSKVDPSTINKGNEYKQGDRLLRGDLNAIINNSIFASTASADALEKANSAFTANGTVVRYEGVPQAFLDFTSQPQQQINNLRDFVYTLSYFCYRNEVVYDKDSSNVDINWGFTAGITSSYGEGITISGKDFSKYKKLKITCGNNLDKGEYGSIYSFEVDLTKSINGVYRGTIAISSPYVPLVSNSENQDARRAIVTINSQKTEINFVGVYATSATYSPANYDTEILIKIEGIY